MFTRQVEETIQLKNISVIPYSVIRPHRGETMVRSPLSGDMYRAGKVEENAEEILTELLMESLKGKSGLQPVTRAAMEDVLEEESVSQKHILMGPFQAAKLGKRFQTDGVLIGFIYAFRERVGKAYSVDSPASVSFDLYLVESATGRNLWKAGYTRTQQPISQNVLDIEEYLQSGVRWLTARELAKVGLKMMLKECPYIKGDFS